MSLSGPQTTNAGYLAAQAYFNDPNNETAPTPSFKEGEIGVAAFTLAQLASVTADASRIPTADQDAAIDGASTPSASNVFATMNDLAAFSSPTSVVYNFSTTVGAPSSGEITMDNATPASVTEIHLHNLNRAGQNVGNILLTLENGDAIIIQDNLEGDKTYNFDITGTPTQTGGSGASGYVTIPVSLFAEGATQITSSDVVVAATYVNGGSTIPAASISGALTNATIAAGDITGTLDLASQVSGTLPGASVGTGISASNVTTGTLSGSLVGTGINATNITTGTLSGSLVGTGISATNITTGSLSGSLVGTGISATNITTGSLSASLVDGAGAVMNSDSSTASMSFVIDEDDMVSDSSTKVPTQQSVKAYVTSSVGSVAASSDFAVDLSEGLVGTTTSFSSNEVGTGIDITAGTDYTNSTFVLAIHARFGVDENCVMVRGVIKKSAGTSDVVSKLLVTGGVRSSATNTNGRYGEAKGTLASSGSTLSVPEENATFYANNITDISLERIHTANELCFRLNLTTSSNITDPTLTILLEGQRLFAGTEITPGQGNKF